MIRNLASVYGSTQNYSVAEALYQHAIDVSPEYIHAYMDLGNLLQIQKKYAEAGQVCEWQNCTGSTYVAKKILCLCHYDDSTMDNINHAGNVLLVSILDPFM